MLVPFQRKAEVYLRDQVFLIGAVCRVRAGFWISTGSPVALPEHSDDLALATAIRDALARSVDGIPDPDRNGFKEILAPLLKAAGVRSWKAFVRGTALVTVQEIDGDITLSPARNTGARDGFAYDPDREVIVKRDSLTDLPRTLRRLLQNSMPQ